MATFYNQASLSYTGGTASSNIVSGELLEAITVTKTATAESYREGESVTYAIGLVNTSSSASSTLTVTDDLGAYLFGSVTVYPLVYRDGSVSLFINGVPSATPTVSASQPLTVTGITVPAGGNALLLYTADVTDFASPALDGTVENTAEVSGAGITTPISASESITAASGPLLGIEKEISPSIVTPSAPITYTVTVTNRGNGEATETDSVTVTDVFDPILDITSVTLDGAALTEGTDYTYNDATGEFATVAGRITVPAATFIVDPTSGAYITTPGVSTLVIVGTVQ